MFDQLSSRLAKVVKTMRGQARITESNAQEMLREVRMALLEADVALPVVRDFMASVKDKALGEEVVGSLTPGQALVGVVQRELTVAIGGQDSAQETQLNFNVQPPAVILMAGLQGAGKTTTTAKLAKWLQEGKHAAGKKKVLTVSCDVYRPAAIEQLRTVTEQAGATWFASRPDQSVLQIAQDALNHAKLHYFDVLLVDTAGRLAVDQAMMDEIAQLHAALNPIETLFVVDAMVGQDAVNTAKAFGAALPLTGVVLTKLDGDSRGGAALSVRHVTGKPVKFVGVGEKLNGLELFHPERVASRILGMGDIVSLVEQAQQAIDVEEAQKLAAKIKSGDKFDLNDFKAQLAQMKNFGNFSSMLEKLPGAMGQAAANIDQGAAEKQIRRVEGIINSMTLAERTKPDLIKASRKRRIAAGAGVPVQEVNRLLSQYEQMAGLMKQMKKGGLAKMMRAMGGGFGKGKLGGPGGPFGGFG